MDSIENTRGAIAIANNATVSTGTDDTQAVTSLKLEQKLANYHTNTADINTTSGAYTLISTDISKDIFINNTLTIPVLSSSTVVWIDGNTEV